MVVEGAVFRNLGGGHGPMSPNLVHTVLGQKSAAPHPTNISIILFNQQSTTSRLLKCLETLHNDYIHTKQEFPQKLIFNI